jgi:periplasmic divalent cation tolerance protein
MSHEYVVVLCTAPADAAAPKLGAERLAEALVEAGVCACVNIVPGVVSYYRWQGKVERGEERLLVLKTLRGAMPRLLARLAEWHPYEVPEVLELGVDGGSRSYLAWLRDSVDLAGDA